MSRVICIPTRIRWALALLLSGLLTGCATQKIDWSARVGNFSFDQAVLQFGPPDKQAKLSDGVLVAEWITSRGSSQTYGAYGYGYPRLYYGPAYPGYLETHSPDYFLRLIFGPDGRLKSWKQFTR